MLRTVTLLAVTLLMGGCALFVERPEYTVIERHDGFELRRYPSQIVAETVVQGGFREAGNRAFPILAGYIGGENRQRQDISMTAPVSQVAGDADGTNLDRTAATTQTRTDSDDGAYVLSFVMPASYTLETLPEPTDERVRLRRIEGRLMAALRYSGTWSRERYAVREKRLLEAVRAAGLTPTGPPVFARYNPPITPWFLRRNEILVPVTRR